MSCEIALFDSCRLRSLDGTMDLNTHNFKVALLSSAFAPVAVAAWVPAQTYMLGDIVETSAGQFVEVVVPGVSSGTQPTWDTLRGSVTADNTVTWRNWGLTPPSTYALWSEISAHEVTGAGYTAGGVNLGNPSLTLDRRTVTWSADNVDFGAVVLTAAYAAIYRNGTENSVVNPLVAYVRLDSTGLDITLTLDNPFTLAWTSAGIINFS